MADCDDLRPTYSPLAFNDNDVPFLIVSGCDIRNCSCEFARKRGIFGVEGLMDGGLGHR